MIRTHQVLWSDRITVYISSLTSYLIGMKRSHISGLGDLDQQFTQGFLMDHFQSRCIYLQEPCPLRQYPITPLALKSHQGTVVLGCNLGRVG